MLWHTRKCSLFTTFEIGTSACELQFAGRMIRTIFFTVAALGAGALAACGDDTNAAAPDAAAEATTNDVAQQLDTANDSTRGSDSGFADAFHMDAFVPDASQTMDASTDVMVNGDVTAGDADAAETADASDGTATDGTATDGPTACSANELCAQNTSQGPACLPSCSVDGGECTGGMVCTVTSGCCTGTACSAAAVRVCCPASGC